MSTLLDVCAREIDGDWGGDGRSRWVMDLARYKQLRSECAVLTGLKADPDTWIPDPSDQLFGIPVEVRDDGGLPHLEMT